MDYEDIVMLGGATVLNIFLGAQLGFTARLGSCFAYGLF
jgi:hypothetical protein